MNISSRQLDAFIALAAHRNFTRAAAQCSLSQSAFSSVIRTLEDGLGVRLFDRSTRHVDLTVEGSNFLDAAIRIRSEIDRGLDGLRDAAMLQRGRVSIALLPSLAAGWLPLVLAEFKATCPGIDFDIADVLSEPCIDRVSNKSADFALAAIQTDTPELQALPFCTDSFHLVCRADHPLARRRSISVSDLAACPFIHLARTSSVRQYLEATFRPQVMKTLVEVEQLATVMGFVRAGLGISVVPTLTLFHFNQPEIVTRPLSLPGLTRQIYLVRRRDRGLSVAAQAFHDLMIQRRPK